jgi:predicted subunit of tRNA(5-methylaminomethyl-2-thiouridylate) methyltransferase
MAKRKAISVKSRFEVFKRDSFTCQYCGRGVPDVILNVDHITPVAKGGDNEILNLVTACFDCNAGKSDRALSDQHIINKQLDQLKALNERKEQMEMLAKWRQELQSMEETQIASVAAEINKHLAEANKVVQDWYLRTEIKPSLKKYGYIQVLDAVDISASRYLKDVHDHSHRDDFLTKIPRICYWQKREADNPIEAELRKIAYTANKRWSTCYPQTLQHQLFKIHRRGIPVKDIYTLVVSSRGITQLETQVAEWFAANDIGDDHE